MKRIVCLLFALLLCLTAAVPAYAQEDFVPSVSRPEAPEAVGDILLSDPQKPEENEPVSGCVVITTVTQAEEKTTDIYQEQRDLLLEIYEEVSYGNMTMPLPEHYQVVDLLDVSFQKSDCVETDHTHGEQLRQEETVMIVTFEVGAERAEEMVILLYTQEQWEPVRKVINNGDGTVTCHLQSEGPVAFCVPGEIPQQTEPEAVPEFQPAQVPEYPLAWVLVLIFSFLLFLILIFLRRRKKDEEEET